MCKINQLLTLTFTVCLHLQSCRTCCFFQLWHQTQLVTTAFNYTKMASRSWKAESNTHTHTHTFNGPFSGTTWVSRYQKGKTNLDLTEARDSEWQWHQLGHMQVCISLHTDNHASTPPLNFFYRPDALPAAQPTASKHWRQIQCW